MPKLLDFKGFSAFWHKAICTEAFSGRFSSVFKNHSRPFQK